MKSKHDELVEFLNTRFEPLSLPDGKFLELDLGCGEGTFAVLLAERYPDRQIMAADVMLGRVRKLCRKIFRRGLGNVRALRGDVRHLVGALLPDGSVDRLHILCPDPWPKGRHRWHRLISSELVGQLARVIKKGGTLHIATDDVNYLSEAERAVELSGLFDRDDSLVADLAGISTDFEARFAAVGTVVQHYAWRSKGL